MRALTASLLLTRHISLKKGCTENLNEVMSIYNIINSAQMHYLSTKFLDLSTKGIEYTI